MKRTTRQWAFFISPVTALAVATLLAALASGPASAQTLNTYSQTFDVSGYDTMLVPEQQGMLSGIRGLNARYPSGYFNMQFIAFYNSSTQAIRYIQTQDAEGRVIDWKVYYAGPTLTLELTFYRLDSATTPVVDDATMTAADTTQFFQKVVDKYKQWALQQAWCQRVESPLDKVQTMVSVQYLNTAGSAWNNQISPYLDCFNGEPTGAFVWLYRRFDFDTKYPDYLFPSGFDSAAGIAALKAKNCNVIMPYVNACLWDENSTESAIGPANPGAWYDADDMIRNADQTIPCLSAKPNLKYVCQARLRWKDAIEKAWTDLKAAGATGVYLDMAANTEVYLCHAANHGHVAGDPLVYQNEMKDLMDMIRDDGGIIVTEGINEIYLNRVDGFLGWLGTVSTNASQVPLFHAVYGEAERSMGWIVFPSSDTSTWTADVLKMQSIKAANFGSLCYGSALFTGGSASVILQDLMRTDPNYADALSMYTTPIYKQVYERGMGAEAWTRFSGTGDAYNAYDAESGQAAVHFSSYGSEFRLTADDYDHVDLTFDIKTASYFNFWLEIQDTNNQWHHIDYPPKPVGWTQGGSGYYHIGVGTDADDGQWRTIRRNVQDDLRAVTGDASLEVQRIRKIRVLADGLIDNLTLSDPPMVYEDGTSIANWVKNGTGDHAIQSVWDADKQSDVLQITGVPSRDASQYFTRVFLDTERFDLVWDMKTSQPYYILVWLRCHEDSGYYYMLYDQNARDFRQTAGACLKVGLGTDTTDGKWRTFRRNLADDFYAATGKSVRSVLNIVVRGNMSVDNIALYGNGVRSSGR